MKTNEITRGAFVLSLAGRDRGRIHVVVNASDGYADIVDGVTRKTESPKRKKFKHLDLIEIDPFDGDFCDKEIRECIRQLSVD
jgi:ribosomal protein L14E/L6E/L27E